MTAGGSRSTKHFWLARMVARITSGGMSRNAPRTRPSATTGHSTSPATSSSSPSSSISSRPWAKREALRVGEDDRLAPLGVEHDLGLGERGDIVVETADANRLRRQEAMAVGDVARRDPADGEGHDLRRLVRAAERAEDRVQRPDPAQRVGLRPRRRPSASTSATESAHDRRHDLGQHLARRAARLLDHGDVELALLRVGLDLGVLDARQPRALEEALDRRLRRADARPLALLAPARLRLRQADDMQRQPARRGEGLRALVRQVRSTSALVTSRFKSSAACRCMRAGISSLNSSRSRSGIAESQTCKSIRVCALPFSRLREKVSRRRRDG